MAAKLPSELVKEPPAQIRDIEVGTTAYVGVYDMVADSAGQCYLDPLARLSTRDPSTIQVTRRPDGYHVTVIARHKWQIGSKLPAGAIPVESISQDLDPELDSELRMAQLQELLKKAEGG